MKKSFGKRGAIEVSEIVKWGIALLILIVVGGLVFGGFFGRGVKMAEFAKNVLRTFGVRV